MMVLSPGPWTVREWTYGHWKVFDAAGRLVATVWGSEADARAIAELPSFIAASQKTLQGNPLSEEELEGFADMRRCLDNMGQDVPTCGIYDDEEAS